MLLVFQVGILGCALGNVGYLVVRNRWKAEVRAMAAAGESEGRERGEREPKGDASAWFRYTL